MKQTNLLKIWPLLAPLLLAGCSADGTQPAPADDLVPLNLTATVLAGGGQSVATTRGASDLQNTQLLADEPFQVYFPSGIVSGAGDVLNSVSYTANGSGGTSSVSPGQPYFARSTESATVHAYHGKSGYVSEESQGTAVTNATTSFTVAADQSTDAAYQASDLMYAVTTVAKAHPSALADLQFTHKMAKIVVNASIDAGISISAVNIVSGYRTVNIASPMTTDEASTAYLGALDTSKDAIAVGTPLPVFSGTHTTGLLSCAALLPPQTINAASSAPFLQIVTTTGTATFSLQNLALASGGCYTFTVAVTAAAIGATTQITDWVADGSTLLSNFGIETVAEKEESIPEDAEAVDLGLSVKWANMNIGATTETDYGTYFAWGETEGCTVEGSTATLVAENPKTNFTWVTYKWGDGSKFTKYVTTGSEYWGGGGEAADNKQVLDLLDDMAYMTWGGKWRMPTYAEMGELLANTNIKYCFGSGAENDEGLYNGVAGIKFYNKSDNTKFIFLPAAGHRGGTDFYGQTSDGGCWSSSLNSSLPVRAWRLNFSSGVANMYNNFRYDAFTVRAVQDK